MALIHVSRRLPFPALERLSNAGHEVDVWEGAMPPTPAELQARLAQAEGLLCLLTEQVDGALLDAAPRLRVVSNYAVGTDNVDLETCRIREIAVGRTPDVLTDATADLAFALLLAIARRLPEATEAVRAGKWRTFEPARWLGAEVAHKTLLIVGPGRIGTAVAKRAQGFDMQVLTAGRTDDLHALLAGADFVSLHCPLSPETRHLIDAAALATMRPTAFLVNTARGPIVDQRALASALHDGTIAGAALDVTDPEPPPPDDPLLRAPNLLLVPHIGSGTRAAREKMAEMAVDNLLAGLEGRPLPHPA